VGLRHRIVTRPCPCWTSSRGKAGRLTVGKPSRLAPGARRSRRGKAGRLAYGRQAVPGFADPVAGATSEWPTNQKRAFPLRDRWDSVRYLVKHWEFERTAAAVPGDSNVRPPHSRRPTPTAGTTTRPHRDVFSIAITAVNNSIPVRCVTPTENMTSIRAQQQPRQ
jgi:hypothetical protein